MMTMFEVAIICIVAYAATVIIDKLATKWRSLPQFVKNYVGGVLAVAGIADFIKAKRRGDRIGFFVMVPETLVFSNVDGRGTSFTGSIEWHGRTPYPHPRGFASDVEAPDLFVPFASEKWMSYASQAVHFNWKQDVQEFFERKLRENRENDRRMRFVRWVQEWSITEWRFWFGLASTIMVVVTCFGLLYQAAKVDDNREVVSHITSTNGEVSVVRTTVKDSAWLLMAEGHGDELIVKGRVWRIQPLGGGLSRACITRATKRIRCGFASQNLQLKEGDEAYLRDGEQLWWSDTDKVPGKRTYDSWFIAASEASSLVANSKFQIIE